MNFIIFDGLSASIRDEDETLFGLIKSAFPFEPKIRLNSAESMDGNFARCMEFLKKREGFSAICGKSKGAGQAYETARRISEVINNRLLKKIEAVILVDPHFSLIGDSRIGVYGGSLKTIPSIGGKFKKINIFQRNKWPKGCPVWDGATNIDITGTGADHWNITSQYKKQGKVVAKIIGEAAGVKPWGFREKD